MPHLIPAVGTERHARMVARSKSPKRPLWTAERQAALATSGLSPAEIVAAVARDHNLAPRDLTGDDQRSHVHEARIRALRVLAQAHQDLSLAHLCRCIGRGRTTYLANIVASVRLTEGSFRPSSVGMSGDVARIVARSAAAFGTTTKAIAGRSQTQAVVQARFHAIHAVREAKPHLSLPQLGRMFSRHHTTILSALRAMERNGVPQPNAAPLHFGEAA